MTDNFTKEERSTLDRIVRDAQSDMSGEQKRYIDISRIPLICFSIVQIGKDVNEMKNLFKDSDSDKETRLRSLESNMWKGLGIMAIIAPIIATVVTIFITRAMN